MPATCVIGLQWGDEAKGKIVDFLTKEHEIVVRYQGGANAGHTVVLDGKKYKLSLIPSGIFNPNVKNVIAGGVVINPASLLGEIETLAGQNVKISDNLMISERAHVIFPWHALEDKIFDSLAGKEAIGSTMRGIGPCYRDKVGRSLAFRIGDLYRPEFKDRVADVSDIKKRQLRGLVQDESVFDDLDPAKIFCDFTNYAKQLKPHVCDTTAFLLDAVDADKKILFEGAQGALLDIDHGTFPYVTSSNSSGTGVSSGSGVPGSFINRVVGIVKAYTTRVGGGPFPTELNNEIGQRIRDRGHEYGTVTGRPRRCGWFDAVAARYTARLSGVTCLSVMLLDVLSGFDELQICTAYEINGRRTTDFPANVEDLREVKCVYETVSGWEEEITEVQDFAVLPENAKKYVRRISELLGRPIAMVSVGPDRKQTIIVSDGKNGCSRNFR